MLRELWHPTDEYLDKSRDKLRLIAHGQDGTCEAEVCEEKAGQPEHPMTCTRRNKALVEGGREGVFGLSMSRLGSEVLVRAQAKFWMI